MEGGEERVKEVLEGRVIFNSLGFHIMHSSLYTAGVPSQRGSSTSLPLMSSITHAEATVGGTMQAAS